MLRPIGYLETTPGLFYQIRIIQNSPSRIFVSSLSDWIHQSDWNPPCFDSTKIPWPKALGWPMELCNLSPAVSESCFSRFNLCGRSLGGSVFQRISNYSKICTATVKAFVFVYMHYHYLYSYFPPFALSMMYTLLVFLFTVP